MAIDSNGGRSVLPASLIAHAERSAELTAATLDATGLFPKRPILLPANFLLEFAAVLQLGIWEERGLCRRLDADLPTFSQASKALADRAANAWAEFLGADAAPLHEKILSVWSEQIAWQAREILDADVVLSDVNEDAFADLVAEFIWQHRDKLEDLLDCEGGEDAA